MAVSTPPLQPHAALTTLDRVQSLDDLNHFEPGEFAQALQADLSPAISTEMTDATSLLPAVAARLDALHQVLLAIEPFARKLMGIRMLHVLAAEPVSPQLRTLLATTVLSYAGDLSLLARRFERTLSVHALDAVLASAESVLALRHELQLAVFALAHALCTAYLPRLAKAARSPLGSDAQRGRLRQACLDLQRITQSPELLLQAPFEVRLKTLPVPNEDTLPRDPEARPTTSAENESPHGRFALLEID